MSGAGRPEAGSGAGAGAVAPRAGWIAPEVREELPELRLHWVALDAAPRRSPREVKERLRELSDRFHGGRAIALRRDPIPWAYRVFYRHVGLDPDTTRTPIEAAVLERLMRGRFRSHNLLDDALTIALVETGVPVWALDAGAVEGELGIRAAAPGERLGRDPQAPSVPPGRLVVADARTPLGVLFGDLAPGHGVHPRTARMTLFALQVAGVPAIHVEEALWSCTSLLAPG